MTAIAVILMFRKRTRDLWICDSTTKNAYNYNLSVDL